VVLLDLFLPDRDGIAVLQAIRQDSPGSRVAMLTSSPDDFHRLTPRELDVLGALARGQANREIARSLLISEETVKTHVSSILTKLGLADRTQAALYALRRSLSRPDPPTS
jgi:DNA-binding NarL/FixJ family response regulator